MGDEPPLILTLTLDGRAFALFDGLRRQHFPPERNQVPAHLTLFHTLPGAERPAIAATLDAICRKQTRIALRIAAVKFTGAGVAYAVQSFALESLRRTLAAEWSHWLTLQDAQGFRPHITVQNKVPPSQARALHAELVADFSPFEATGEGVQLWSYLGGPWKAVRTFRFGA